MRTTLLGVAAICMLCAGCQAVTPATPSLSQPTVQPAPTNGATLPPSAASTSASGEPTIVVVFAGGPNAGTLTGTANPLCSHGILGDDTWGVEYDDFKVGDGQIAGMSLKDAPDHTNNDQSRVVSATILVAPFGTGGLIYKMALDRSSSNSTAEVQDNGTTATMHFAGTSAATQFGGISDPSDVPIDITVNCPAVTTPADIK